LYKASNLIKRYDDTAQVSSRALLLSYLVKQRMGRIEDAEKIAATILQTYPNSVQANAIRDNQLRQTEFEVLREKYRQAQLDELQESSNNNQIIAEPKIKVIRKKSPTSAVNSDDSVK
jgi:type IV pilus assembly protein PilF